MGRALSIPARAKLNLTLRVVGRRADGYHLLDTVFHTLALHDDLVVARAPAGVTLAVSGDRDVAGVPTDARNLVVRALQLLQEAVGDHGGFAARLHKRIPHGGGLGGGSSDAAAALRLGNRLLGDPLDGPALDAVAVRLGADVPFFLRGGTQRGRGIGDQLEPLAVPSRHFVLVLPPFGCETAAVYKNHAAMWNEGAAAATVPLVTVLDNRDTAVGIGYANDLEAAAERLQPGLSRLRRAIAAAGVPDTHMTGSGSTLFVPFDEARAAERCARELRSAVPTVDDGPVEYLVTASGPPPDVDDPTDT
ncbi:MAG: 4-(cytidine 5'-diphospho)-2-C-methyl-D-erythritol kinase [Planctomycetes bacterium]|nr:4-(cytidine 5'-diphospho)-2-C-methyl-D-erythritol kinase [Planctomycetota bacterium]